jgi:hypothetical protein
VGFSEIVKEWAGFYSVLAGSTATLLGLLFVALSIHASYIHKPEHANWFRLARLTFSNYLMLLSLCLQFVIPGQRLLPLSVALLVLASVGLFWTTKIYQESKLDTSQLESFLKKSYRTSFVTYGVLALFVVFMIRAPGEGIRSLLVPALLLTFGSIRNSWGLLTMIQTTGI